MRTLVAVLIPVMFTGCGDVCRAINGTTAGPPVVEVNESVEYEARAAGIPAGELRGITEELLRSRGVRIASNGVRPTITVDINVKVIDPGMSGYAGLIQLTVREPATLWATGRGVQVITSTHDLVFTTPKRDLREYVRENLRDAVAQMIENNPRLVAK